MNKQIKAINAIRESIESGQLPPNIARASITGTEALYWDVPSGLLTFFVEPNGNSRFTITDLNFNSKPITFSQAIAEFASRTPQGADK